MGWGGGLVLVLCAFSLPREDKHKAPTLPHSRPLSLLRDRLFYFMVEVASYWNNPSRLLVIIGDISNLVL